MRFKMQKIRKLLKKYVDALKEKKIVIVHINIVIVKFVNFLSIDSQSKIFRQFKMAKIQK